MPAPLDPEKREAIEQAIRDGGNRNAIGREHGVAGSTVGRIAKQMEDRGDLNPGSAFDRANTKNARAALDEDQALQRSKLAGLLMADAFKVRERMWEEQTEYFGSMDGPTRVVRPTNAREFKDFSTAIGILVDKVGVLTKTEDGSEQAATLLGSLVDEIRARRVTPDPEPAVSGAAE